MNTFDSFATGIAPEHLPAFVAALLLIPGFWLGFKAVRHQAAHESDRANRVLQRWDAASYAGKLVTLLLMTTGVVHLFLPLGHERLSFIDLTFWASGGAFIFVATKLLSEDKWRFRAAVLLTANIVAYLVVAGSGWLEEADQVGIATKLVELTAFGLIVVPQLRPADARPARGIRRRLARPAASAALVLLTFATGLVIWVGSFVAHGEADEEVAETDGWHNHIFAARAQAGLIMHASPEDDPTSEQIEAAVLLANATKAQTAAYEDYDAAIADGYERDGPEIGLEVHLANKANQKDGRTLDPARPELLVYAADGDHYVLLGVAYTMEKAGDPGPEIGGSLTRWHAHNVCVTLMPPGFGIVSPFGTCPIGAVSVTLPEMIHVWTVENPDGPYAQHLEDDLVRDLLADSNDAHEHDHEH